MTRTIMLAAQPGLDPLTIYVENYEPGKGMLTVVCYGTAWTAYWGGMGTQTVEQFVADCDYEYVASNLIRSPHMKQSKSDLTYVQRIAIAIIKYFKECAACEQ